MTDEVREKPKKRRRARGDGSIYLIGRTWWIAYKTPDGRRQAESSGSQRKGDAEALLRRRVGAKEHNLPVVAHAEKLTFDEGAEAVINDFKANGQRSLKVAQRRIAKHLKPVFGGRRLLGITAADVLAFIAKRQADTIRVSKARVMRNADGTETTIAERRKPVSVAEINRELQILKRIFNLAIEQERIAKKPKIKLLKERNTRTGFFERDQLEAVLRHLPDSIQPVIRFAAITGWRIPSEVLPLEWRQVDFAAGEIRLNAHTTKNDEGRVFPMTRELRTILEAQRDERDAQKKAGHIVSRVFFRLVADGRGGDKKPRPIVTFYKAWRAACLAAGCPGRIGHDFRRTAVRNLVRLGIPESVAQKMTGHKTRSVFDRYDITSAGDLKDAARKLDQGALAMTTSANAAS